MFVEHCLSKPKPAPKAPAEAVGCFEVAVLRALGKGTFVFKAWERTNCWRLRLDPYFTPPDTDNRSNCLRDRTTVAHGNHSVKILASVPKQKHLLFLCKDPEW